MKIFNFLLGFFVALACVLVVVLLDFDLFYTVGKFGGLALMRGKEIF